MPVILDAPRLGLEHPRFVGWGRKAWVDGEAILARDRLSGLPVAWSSFPKTSAGGWRSFTDLAPSLGRDLHPGLARLIGYGREERSAWIAEEWIPGTTSLADRERAASLASRDLRGLLLQFAAALAALHAAGLVHGRLTPAHLRFTRDLPARSTKRPSWRRVRSPLRGATSTPWERLSWLRSPPRSTSPGARSSIAWRRRTRLTARRMARR